MATYWVNNVIGDDASGDGSESAPWKTIAKAMTIAAQGDTVRVVNHDGSVYEPATVTIGAAYAGTDFDSDPGLILEGYPNDDWPTLRNSGVIGSPPTIKLDPNCDYVVIRNFKFSAVGPTTPPGPSIQIEWQAVNVRIECCEWGSLYRDVLDAILVVGTGDRRTQLEVRCCYWHPGYVTSGGWRRFVQWNSAQDPATLSIHHCIVQGGETPLHSTGAGGSHATIDVYNNTFVDSERCIYLASFNSTGTVHVWDNIFSDISIYVYYCPNAIQAGTLTIGSNNYHNCAAYCNHPTCATCQISAPGAGAKLVDPQFIGPPQWEWLYGLVLDENYTPQNGAVLTGASGGGAIGAIDPDVPAPCLCAIPIPSPPCDPCEVLDCNYSTFSGGYPGDWQVLLAKPAVPAFVKVVCYDPEGLAYQLTPFVRNANPLRQSRDIKLGTYDMSDLEIELVDPEGQFDVHNPSGLLYNDNWFGKHVDYGIWLVGTSSVLKLARMFLFDTIHYEGITRLKLQDLFGWMLLKNVRANSAGKTTVDGGGGFNDARVDVNSAICKQESWTLTFATATTYNVVGSKTGSDGLGSISSDFGTDSGSISIQSAAFSGGPWAPGDTITFRTGVRFTGENVITAARSVLVDLADVPESWLEETSWNELEALSDAYQITLWHDKDRDALTLLRTLMLHRFAAAYADHDGKIAVMTFIPGPSAVINRCIGKRWSLIECQPAHLPILNDISVESGYGEGGSATAGGSYPLPGSINPSVARYNFSFPYAFKLRGYTGGEQAVMEGLCEQIFTFYAGLPDNPREYYQLLCKPYDINVVVGEIVYVDSARPVRGRYALVYDVEKDPDNAAVTAYAVDVSDLVEAAAGCGYGFCGAAGQTDDCWVYGF